MARTSTPWRLLPARELGCGSPATCWRRLTEWANAANVADVTMLATVVDDIPPVRTPSGRRRARPASLHADKGYDGHANRAWLRRRGIRPRIARRGMLLACVVVCFNRL
jgi:Transposase DDE domain